MAEAKCGLRCHPGFASRPVDSARKASITFGKAAFGSSLAAIQSAALSAAPARQPGGGLGVDRA
jgi:hypothetical protein